MASPASEYSAMKQRERWLCTARTEYLTLLGLGKLHDIDVCPRKLMDEVKRAFIREFGEVHGHQFDKKFEVKHD